MRTKTMKLGRAALRWLEAFFEVRLPIPAPGLRTPRR